MKEEVGHALYTTHVTEFHKAWREDASAAFARFGLAYIHSLSAEDRLELYRSHGWTGKDAADHFNIGTLELKRGNIDAARAAYAKALEADANHYETLRNLTILEHREGNDSKAKQYGARAVDAALDGDERADVEEFLETLK